MRVKITQCDIDNGQRYSGWSCPLSYAFRKAFNSKNAFIGVAACLDNNISIELTREAMNWRAKYDKGEKVEPIEISFSPEMIYRRNI